MLGIELFLARRAGPNPGEPKSTRWRKILSTMFVKFSVSWVFASVAALTYARVPTGTACPLAWRYGSFVPYLQVSVAFIDAILLVSFNNLRSAFIQQGRDYTSSLIQLSLVSAGCLLILAVPPWLEDRNFFWMMYFRYVDIRDLLLDGILASFVLICGFYLLSVLSATTVALIATSVGLFGIHIPYFAIGTVLPPLDSEGVKWRMAIVALNATPLWFLLRQPKPNSRPAVTAVLHRWLSLCYVAVIGLAFCFWLAASPQMAHMPLPDAVRELTSLGRSQAGTWQFQAATSDSLAKAVDEYKKRHGIPPPPNFDKWYNYAVESKSPIIDDFTQIHQDLLPFWGVKPSEIRKQTHEIQRYASVEMVGLRIRGGAIEKSPHIHKTHQWMIDSIGQMVEPFAQWLPDMDIAINVADEPRVALSYKDRRSLISDALKTLARLEHNMDLVDGPLKGVTKVPHWPSEFPESIGTEGKVILPSGFTNYIRKPILYDLVGEACPSNSALINTRWWERSTLCTDCQQPHSLMTDQGPLVLNDTLSKDYCHQPDTAHLTGAVSSPSAMFATRQLLPVFSQGRISGFSDILIPSPWSFDDLSPYDEAADLAWSDKTNSIFWRGGSTDGYAAEGSWAAFTRARFVHEAYERSPVVNDQGRAGKDQSASINVSFSGDLSRCHKADCRAELQTFSRWGTMTETSETQKTLGPPEKRKTLPPTVPFSEHWRFRHLMDMDGAGFSGRFIPFLRSNSLVYRAAMYRTWMDERVQAWQHYVPADVRLGAGFWALVDYLSGRSGDAVAREVARNGREWALRALRKEDMQVYMFRLLLEWGRVVNDEREHLFYEG